MPWNKKINFVDDLLNILIVFNASIQEEFNFTYNPLRIDTL